MSVNEDDRRVTHERDCVSLREQPGRPFSLTMEIPLFITMLTITLSGPVLGNILLYRTCVHALNHSVYECEPFLEPAKSNTTKQLEEEVQKYTTNVSIVKTVLECVGPAILSMFLGVWSDTYGRKPLVVWPLFGLSISAILTVVYAMLHNLGPWWIVLTAVPISLTGGFTSLFTGAFTYLSDITATKDRSFRLTLLEVGFSAGSLVGSLVSLSLIQAVGNTNVLLINAALNVIAYAHANIFIVESLSGALQGGICTLIDFLLVKELITTCFKRRPNRGRAQLLLLVTANSLSIFIVYGIVSLSYMYTREKLHWAIKEYSVYSATNTLIFVIGAIVGVKVGQIFGISDLPLAIVGYLTALIEYVIIAYAFKTWHMYLGSVISILKALTAPLIRSHLTKTLPLEDIAKAFALMCAAEAVCPLISPLVYNYLYRYTIDSFPGAIYMLSASITFLCLAMLVMVQYNVYKYSSKSYERVEENDSNCIQDNIPETSNTQ